MTNLTYFFRYLPFYFRLNRTGNDIFSKQIETYWYNISSVSLHIKVWNWAKLLSCKLWYYSSKTKTDNYKKDIYFCSNSLFLASSTKILKSPCLLENALYFSTDSSMNALNFAGRVTLSAIQICSIIASKIKNCH